MGATITASQLNRLAADSDKRKYNRLLEETFKADGNGWQLQPIFAHHFAEGEQSETHLRCLILRDGEQFGMLDVSLPAAEAILGWDTSKLCRSLIASGSTDISEKNRIALERLRREDNPSNKLKAAAVTAAKSMTGTDGQA